ncbi:zinc finger, CCHC-type containing protein [Tanacetum coccineum]
MVAWKKIATWAYTVGLPFNAVHDESFQDMIYAIREYGRGMPAPSYHNLRVTLLKDALEDTKKFVDSFRPQWQKYRCSIMSNFWTDGKGRCLINFLLKCPTGTIFLKSIDASKHVKDAQLIVKMINEVIEDVGEENILQFITDNGSNIKAAGAILEEQHPKLFWTPCAAHYVNLVIGDIGEKIPKTKSALSDARAVVDNVYLACQVLAVLTDLVRLVDTEEKPCMGYIYDAMSRAKDQISKNLKGGPNERLVSRVWSMIQTRWTDQFHHPLHAAGCFLNPAIFHGENSKVDTNKEILTDLYVVINRLVPDPDENDYKRWEENVDIRPSTRSKTERYRDDDDEINVGGGLEEEVNALDDVDSDAEPLDCN